MMKNNGGKVGINNDTIFLQKVLNEAFFIFKLN